MNILTVQKEIKPYITVFFAVYCCLFCSFYLKANENEVEGFQGFVENIEVTGSMTAEMTYYNAGQFPDRRDPFAYRIYGNPRIQSGDWDIPVQILLGNYQKKYRQHFNKIGISPSYKWATLHLGHTNVNFSPLVFSGHTLLGGGVELNPGKFRFGILYGRLQRPVEPDTAITDFFIPTYSRSGLAIKAGYGTRENFVDVTFLRARDHITSTDFDPEEEFVFPAENAAIGITTHQRFLSDFYFKFNLGMSAYSVDTRAEEESPEDFQLGVIPSFMIRNRVSTQYYSALETSLEYRQQNFSVQLAYDRVDPEYKTMGTYFIRNDMKRVRLSSRINLPKQNLSITPQIGLQRNNLFMQRLTTNNQVIGGLRAMYRPNRNWNIHAGFHNFITRLRQDITATEDTLMMNRVNTNFNGGFTYRTGMREDSRLVVFHINYLTGNDKAGEGRESFVRNINTRLAYRFHSSFMQLYLMPSFNFIYFNVPMYNNTRFGPSLQANRSFLGNDLNVGWNTGLTFSTVNGPLSNTAWRNTFSGTYNFLEKQSIQLRIAYARNFSRTQVNFGELQGDLRYVYQF